MKEKIKSLEEEQAYQNKSRSPTPTKSMITEQKSINYNKKVRFSEEKFEPQTSPIKMVIGKI